MGNVVYSNNREIIEGIIADEHKVVVYFTAPWCGPCKLFGPHFERAASEEDDILFIKVNVDNADWAMLDYGVRSIPTVKLYENGTFARDVKAPQGALPFLRDIRS